MDAIAEIKQKLDVLTVVGQYVSLKKSGRNYKGVCPFHSENTPSFMVSPELQIYKCFGCGEVGDIFKFIEKIEGVDFSTALKQLAEKAGVKLDSSQIDPHSKDKKQILFINELTAQFYNYLLLKHPMGKTGLTYATEKRKLTPATIKSFEIGYAPPQGDVLFNFLRQKGISTADMLSAGVVLKRDSGGYYDRFRDRLMFPLKEIDGKVVGFSGRIVGDGQPKYLNSNETLVFHKSAFLFGLDKARLSIKKEGVVLVEGHLDVITAHQAGFTNVVATSGTSLTDTQLRILSRYTNDLSFLFDSDSAGIAAIYRGVSMAEALNFNIHVIVLPSQYKDIDDLVRDSPDDAKKALANKIPAYDYYLYTTLKQNDKTSPDGKKKIMDILTPKFSSLTNKVLLDHYSNEIAKELNISQETVLSIFSGNAVVLSEERPKSKQDSLAHFEHVTRQHHESYFLTLLLRANLDIARNIGYKLEPEDFSDNGLKAIYSLYLDYIKSENLSTFDPKVFELKLNDEQKQVFLDLYLWDIDGVTSENESLSKELETTYQRLKRESSKRKLADITQKIRLAEKQKDQQLVEKLTQDFEETKKSLI